MGKKALYSVEKLASHTGKWSSGRANLKAVLSLSRAAISIIHFAGRLIGQRWVMIF